MRVSTTSCRYFTGWWSPKQLNSHLCICICIFVSFSWCCCCYYPLAIAFTYSSQHRKIIIWFWPGKQSKSTLRTEVALLVPPPISLALSLSLSLFHCVVFVLRRWEKAFPLFTQRSRFVLHFLPKERHLVWQSSLVAIPLGGFILHLLLLLLLCELPWTHYTLLTTHTHTHTRTGTGTHKFIHNDVGHARAPALVWALWKKSEIRNLNDSKPIRSKIQIRIEISTAITLVQCSRVNCQSVCPSQRLHLDLVNSQKRLQMRL